MFLHYDLCIITPLPTTASPQLVHIDPQHLSTQGVETVMSFFYKVNVDAQAISPGALVSDMLHSLLLLAVWAAAMLQR